PPDDGPPEGRPVVVFVDAVYDPPEMIRQPTTFPLLPLDSEALQIGVVGDPNVDCRRAAGDNRHRVPLYTFRYTACPVFIASRRSRASPPRTSPMMIRSG